MGPLVADISRGAAIRPWRRLVPVSTTAPLPIVSDGSLKGRVPDPSASALVRLSRQADAVTDVNAMRVEETGIHF